MPVASFDPNSCRADVNSDGVVNWMDSWLVSHARLRHGQNLPEDVNQDGRVNSLDLEIITNNKGLMCNH